MRAFPRSVRPRSDIDNLAARLLDIAYVARKMAPVWDAVGMCHPVNGVEGQPLGWVLPGRGVYVDYDLSSLGINRHLPWVFERTRTQRLLDRLGDERGAINTYDGIINARANGKGEDIVIAKSTITTVSGFWYDTFRAGGYPAAGTYNTTTAPTDTATDRTTTGAAPFTNPAGSDRKYLIAMGWACSSAHNFAVLVDMHTQGGVFRTSVTSAETIASPDTTVRVYGPGTNGTGNQLIFTVTTARTTPTTSNLTLTYLDEAGNTSTPAIAMTNNADPVDRLLALPNVGSPFAALASGDLGVRSLSQTQKAATADAAGGANGQIVTPLQFIPGIVANVYAERDAPMNIDGLTELANSSQVIGCLKVLVFAGAGSLGTMMVPMRSCQG